MDDQNVTMVIDVDGTQTAFGTVRLSAQTVELHGSVMVAEFHKRSAVAGLAMSDQEIREACWAPLAAKLVEMSGIPLADRAEQEVTFAHRALGFLIMAAFGEVRPGERFVFAFSGDGAMRLYRRPHRLLGRNRHVFGNYRKAMLAPATAFGQVG